MNYANELCCLGLVIHLFKKENNKLELSTFIVFD